MGFSQHGVIHFLKGVPGWSWTPFLIDFRSSEEAWGDHLRDLGSFWEHLESLRADSEVTLAHIGSIGVTSRGLWGHFGAFGGSFPGLRPWVCPFCVKYIDSLKEFIRCFVNGSSRVD